MKRFVLTTLVILALGFVTVGADEPTEEEAEQLSGSCGEIKNRNSSFQFGGSLWLEYIVETARPMNSFDCPWLSVSVEAWVVNVSGSGLSSTGPFTASVRRQIPVPHAGNWQTNGKHYRNYLWIFSYLNGETSSIASIEGSNEQDPSWGGGGVGTEACPDPEAFCNAAGDGYGGQGSPILIDVDRDGYRLTSLEDGVFFDLDGDGSAESSHGPAWSLTTRFSRWTATATDGSTMGRSCSATTRRCTRPGHVRPHRTGSRRSSSSRLRHSVVRSATK